ncbi:MAG: PAS domain S-box protein, partial [Actinomycetota bacterium]|nr:PAS domain S-box protein [Actinomycetota bacterium]
LAVRDRLQLSIDRMPVGYIRWDTNGKVTHWNPAAERIFGFTSEEAIGRTLLELVVPEEVRPAVVEVLDRLVAGEEASYSEPGNNLRKDGSVISCQWFNTPLIEATGEVSGVLSMVLDVTERQLAEEALREANTIINLSPAVAFLWKNQEGWPVQYVSRNVKELFGYTAQELMAGDVSYASVIHADDLETVREQDRTYFEEKSRDEFSQEYRIVTKDGQVRWIDERTRMRRNEEGEVTHYQGVVLDITDRKRAEEELRRNEVIVASSSDMLALLDKDYTYLAANSAYLKAFGMTRDQLVGSTASELFGEEYFNGVIRPHADRCLGGERVHFQKWLDLPVSGKVYMDVSYHPYVGADNEVRGFVVDARDITELEATRTKLREMNVALEHLVEARTEQLVAANEELEAFAYSVSHDLKAPLRAIDGYSAMLEEGHGSSLPEDGQRLLGVVRSSAQQMARLIDDLLAFSRIGRVEMVISDVDMRELAQAVFSDLLNVSKLEGDRTVDFNLGELPTVRADLALMRQVWANLLDNALKFTGGREVARIEVDCQEEPDHWVFRVRDNGAGFDMEYVDKLFGVFQRLHYQEEFPGTGVGLATVQRVVQRHGGEVWAEGEVDRGATVFFRLPRSVKPT